MSQPTLACARVLTHLGRARRSLVLAGALLLVGAVPSAWALAPQAAAGDVYGWGSDGRGEIGAAGGPVPTSVAGLTGVVQTAEGCDHNISLRADGTVWAEGWNSFGELGDGTTTDSSTPHQVTGLPRVVQVAAGCYHSMALAADGTVYFWGQQQPGATTATPDDPNCPGLSNTGNPSGGPACFTRPTPWMGPAGATSIAAGTMNMLASVADGSVWANGQYVSNAGNHLTLPSPAVEVAMEDYTAIARVQDGRVFTWGSGATGALGNGTDSDQEAPAPTSPLPGPAVDIAGGMFHGLAVLADGSVVSWGRNNHQQLGLGTTDNERNTPTPVPGLTGVTQVAAGFYHSLARTADGTVQAWGGDGGGQTAVAGGQDTPVPTRVAGLAGVAYVAGGGNTSVAVVATGPGAALPDAAHAVEFVLAAMGTLATAGLRRRSPRRRRPPAPAPALALET